MKHRNTATPFLAILLTVIATSAVWAYVVNRAPSDEAAEIPPVVDTEPAGPGNLSNTDGLPCVVTFWSEREAAIQATGVADDLLPYQTLGDLSVEVCSNASRAGNLVTLTAKRPNGWGQTAAWEVTELIDGRVATVVPFAMTLGFGGTDSTPQCQFNTQARDKAVSVDAYGIPTTLTVDCREADMQGRGTTESFAIDLVAKTATRVDPVPDVATSESGLVSVAYASPLYVPAGVMDGVPRLATVDVALYTDAASYRAPNYSQEGTLVVSHEAWNDLECNTPPAESGKDAFEPLTLNGVEWGVVRYADAGAGNRYDVALARTMFGGTCYQLATVVHAASDWTDVDMDAIAQSQDDTKERLETAAEHLTLVPTN